MSDTPRTDSLIMVFPDGDFLVEVVDCDFARQLERELAEVIAQRHEALEALEGLIDNHKLNNGKGFGIGPKMKAKAAIAKLKGQTHE